MVELKKQVEDLQEKDILSTPPKVLEERSKVVLEAEERIRQGETICTKEVEAISAMWEAFLEDETREKIKENAQKADEKIIATRVEMKKLSFKEKVTKMVEIKQLQHEV